MNWTQFKRVFRDQPADLRASIVGVYLILCGLNLAAWAWAFAVFYSHPILLGTALQNRFAPFQRIGGVIGTSVSAFFLFAHRLTKRTPFVTGCSAP
jgi:high-affinity nickel permease